MNDLTDHPDLAALNKQLPALTYPQWLRARVLASRLPSAPIGYVWDLARVPHPADRTTKPPPWS